MGSQVNLSKISTIFEGVGETISKSPDFKKVPIKWGMIEVTPNTMPPTLVVLEAKPFEYDVTGCCYERQLDIIIIHNTNQEREIFLRLTKYSESLIELLKEYSLTINYDLQFLQGSDIYALRNNREDSESYKGAKTDFSSMIVLTYMLRY